MAAPLKASAIADLRNYIKARGWKPGHYRKLLHVTQRHRLRSILARGLVPSTDSGRLYLTTKTGVPAILNEFSRGKGRPAVIEVRIPRSFVRDSAIDGASFHYVPRSAVRRYTTGATDDLQARKVREYYVERTIPTAALRVLSPKRTKQLQKISRVSNADDYTYDYISRVKEKRAAQRAVQQAKRRAASKATARRSVRFRYSSPSRHRR